ncbi:hypothetical protein MNBD_GAMMA22-1143 [hydrothermal vent metagenome]|uniref:CheW-like domain-containing protein n=1 Tax=hydrothermal vent metagenome TaxID=652676 RepID=A0A3B1A2Z6_9ZZZZ
MLLVSLHIEQHHFVIAAKKIIEILPLTSLKPISRAPDFIAGLLDYRGLAVPVINLCQLNNGVNYNRVLSSRIVLVNYTANNRKMYPLGLIAEKVTETINVSKNEFQASGISIDSTPYLGDVTRDNSDLIHYVKINELLTEQLEAMLFNESYNS